MSTIDSPRREASPEIDARRWLPRGYRWWNLLGGLLIAAAILKARDDDRGFHTILIVAEFAVGCFVLTGVGNSFTKRILKITFLCFILVAAANGVQGRKSCGCFGAAQASPWLVLAFDSAVVAAICLLKERPGPSPAVRETPIRLTFATTAAIAFAIVTSAWRVAIPVLAGAWGREGGGPAVFEPAAWAGRRFPPIDLARLERPDTRIDRGEWLVVLYEHGCADCRAMVPRALRWASGRPGARVAFLDVGATEGASRIPMSIPEEAGERIVAGRVNETFDWFFRTPTLLALRDGRVVPDGWPSEFTTAR